VRAAARGTNAGMERRAEALLFTSLTEAAVQTSVLSCLNITFSVGLQLLPFPFAVVGWLARRGDFVTRLKDNAEYAVVERRLVPEGSAVRRDEIFFFIKWRAAENTICFCGASKSGMKSKSASWCFSPTKTFVGTSPNALQIQIWAALIALLLLKYLQLSRSFRFWLRQDSA